MKTSKRHSVTRATNAVAKELRTTKYRIRRLKNKKKYTRKVKHVVSIEKES